MQIFTSNGENRQLSLQNISAAHFYKKIFENLDELGVDVRINAVPSEIADTIDFYKVETHHTYNVEQIQAFRSALLKIQKVFYEFRSRFRRKCSPVHFFWGCLTWPFHFFPEKELRDTRVEFTEC